MPRRRNHGDGSHSGLASYFYDAQGDGLAPLPQSRGSIKQAQAKGEKASFLSEYDSEGKWIGPGPEPPRGLPRRRHRSQSRGAGERSRSVSVPRPHVKKARPEGDIPEEMNEYEIRHMHKEGMQKRAAEMKKHFHDSDTIYAEHNSWILHATYLKINEHIQQCKTDIAEVRNAHKGPGKHKEVLEAVHSQHIDITEWHLRGIHTSLANESSSHGVVNRLLLDHPYVSEGTYNVVYLNVALAWLFAAKRQLMTIVEADVKKIANKTQKMQDFINACDAGREARNHYLKHKHALGVKKHKDPYHLADEHDLKHQHDVFYGSK